MHYFNCVCLKDFFRKKIMWTNEKLTKEQFVEVRGTRLRVSLRSLATPRRGARNPANYDLSSNELVSHSY